MKIDEELVRRVARLAALELDVSESAAMATQLTRIVEHFEALKALPEELLASAPEPPPTPLRADEAVDRFPGALVMRNAPEAAHGHFVVPRVVTRDG
jgi:aspartyl-tRNA(Asn)/glutamyl-tRNA(Gln) amidotransferase subunit C